MAGRLWRKKSFQNLQQLGFADFLMFFFVYTADKNNPWNYVDGRNPVDMVNMKYAIIYDVFFTSQVVVWDF